MSVFTKLSNGLRRLKADKSGVSAVEFALIAPVMVSLYLGAVEVAVMMDADRRVTATASVVGDLVAQDDEIRNDEIDDIFNAATVIMNPERVTRLEMRVSLIEDNGVGGEVVWSDGRGFAPRAVGSTVAVPAGLMPPGGTLVMSEAQYEHVSWFGLLSGGTQSLSDRFFLRPRRSVEIDRVP